MALLSAVHNFVNLFEAKRSHNLFEFQTPIRANNKHHFIDKIALFKSIQRMSYDRLPAQETRQLVQPHTPAASRRNNNRRIHERTEFTKESSAPPDSVPCPPP